MAPSSSSTSTGTTTSVQVGESGSKAFYAKTGVLNRVQQLSVFDPLPTRTLPLSPLASKGQSLMPYLQPASPSMPHLPLLRLSVPAPLPLRPRPLRPQARSRCSRSIKYTRLLPPSINYLSPPHNRSSRDLWKASTVPFLPMDRQVAVKPSL